LIERSQTRLRGIMRAMSRERSVAIIMYHRIGADTSGQAGGFLNIRTEDFARQIKMLVRLGYRSVTFAEAVAGLKGEAPLPPRAVCLTFDDGHACILSSAVPVLDVLGWKATVFVPSSLVGQLLPMKGEACRLVDADGLRQLQNRGWEIASHTRMHALLGGMADADALREIEGGADDLQALVGIRPKTFCYPGGSYNERTPHLVRQTGLAGACTTHSGLARPGSDPYLLPRVKPATRDGIAGFLYRLLVRPYLP
jgi:peptidoglycan/xylan/chitin deacetylase (PgdA/CDA1 family)